MSDVLKIKGAFRKDDAEIGNAVVNNVLDIRGAVFETVNTTRPLLDSIMDNVYITKSKSE